MAVLPMFNKLLAGPFWLLIGALPGLFVAVPLVTILGAWIHPQSEVWQHLQETMLSEVIVNSVSLALIVTSFATLLGGSLGALVALTGFPGRGFFKVGLLAPMALPAYVLGFVYVGLLDFTGPLATEYRQLNLSSYFDWPEVRSGAGAAGVLTLALYPYVFYLSYGAFSSQGSRLVEVGRSLGLSPLRSFFRLSLPTALPWLSAAGFLVAMETMADFGTVSIFVFDTLTTAIYKAWFGFFSPIAGAQLASLLLIFITPLLLLEQLSQRRRRFTPIGEGRESRLITLSGWRGWLVSSYCAAVFAAGFLIPIVQLTVWATTTGRTEWDLRLASHGVNGLTIAMVTAFIVMAVVALMNEIGRFKKLSWWPVLTRFATLGYALPGSVLAVGLYLPFVAFDRWVGGLLEGVVGTEMPLLLTGSVVLLGVGLVIRFLAVGQSAMAGGLSRVPQVLDEAARGLGVNPRQTFWFVHRPLLAKAIVAGGVLVFVDVLKEMPLTLMTRPYGWDTLAIRIYTLTSEGEWARAAVPALLLVGAGLLPVAILTRLLTQGKSVEQLTIKRSVEPGVIGS